MFTPLLFIILFDFYFQPVLSNIRIASALFSPSIFKSSGSFLNTPHAWTISSGLIFGFTEYSNVLPTYVF